MDESKGSSRKIRSDRAIEYAIFQNEPVTLFLKDSPEKKTSGRMLELTNRNLLLEFKKDVGFNKLLNGAKEKKETVGVRLSYKNAVLLFDATILDIKVHPTFTQVFLDVPNLARLENSRALPRFTLAEIAENLKLQMTIVSGSKTIELCTSHLQDMSEHAISFFFSPDKAMILPGDLVKNLKLFREDSVLIETCGEVSRIDSKRHSPHHAKTYFAVIRFSNLLAENIQKSNKFEERRRQVRLRMDEQKGEVRFQHPLFKDHEIKGELIDIGPSGIFFLLSDMFCPLPLGMFIRDIEVTLPNERSFRVSVKLVHAKREQTGATNQVYIGGEYIELSPESIQSFAKAA